MPIFLFVIFPFPTPKIDKFSFLLQTLSRVPAANFRKSRRTPTNPFKKGHLFHPKLPGRSAKLPRKPRKIRGVTTPSRERGRTLFRKENLQTSQNPANNWREPAIARMLEGLDSLVSLSLVKTKVPLKESELRVSEEIW